MNIVQIRKKTGQKDRKIRRSYSCSDIAQLLGLPESKDSDSEVETEDNSVQREATVSDASTSEVHVAAKRVSAFVKLRKWQMPGQKKKAWVPPVISAPVQPDSFPTPVTSKLATILPQNINFNNPFGTIGRRNKRKQRDGIPVVVLEKCFGAPPPSVSSGSIALPTLNQQRMYPNMSPFATLPRRSAAKLLGVIDECDTSINARACNSHSVDLESFVQPSILVFPSPSSSNSPSPSPSSSPFSSPSHVPSAALTVIEKRASTTNLTTPNYHSLLGKSMEKVIYFYMCYTYVFINSQPFIHKG